MLKSIKKCQKIQTKCDRPKKFTEEEVKKILI